MSFTYVLPRWEGSAYNGRVLKDAISKGFKAPLGRYYLADARYTNSDITLSPYLLENKPATISRNKTCGRKLLAGI